jgi:ATP-dependent Lhr-like helicase
MNKLAEDWFEFRGWKPYPFQRNTWKAIDQGFSGLLNAPTGCGKTYAVWFGIIQDYMKRRLSDKKKANGLHCLWITPLRALSKEIYNAATVVSEDLELPYRIGLRLLQHRRAFISCLRAKAMQTSLRTLSLWWWTNGMN